MAIYRVEGTSGGVFSWFATWDDQTRDLTIDAAGSGRSTVTVMQSSGVMRTVAFVQAPGDPYLWSDVWGVPAPALVLVIGDPATVIPNINLKRNVNPRDPAGGFEVVNESWARI